MSDMERPPIALGSEVYVEEPGIGMWGGSVIALKFSPMAGWYIDVRRDDGLVYAVPSALVHPLEAAHA